MSVHARRAPSCRGLSNGSCAAQTQQTRGMVRVREHMFSLAISVVAPNQVESMGSPSDRRPYAFGRL
jgi:hypothetical protein